MPKRSPATIQALRRSLRPQTWKKRVETAEEQAAIVEAIEQARAGGATEPEALARFAPDWHRSTYHGRRRRYRAGGIEGLISGRKGSLPKTLTPEVRQAVCILRRADSQMPVERIADVVLAQTGIAASATSIKRVLRAEGLNRPPGGGPRNLLPVEDLQFAGAEFFKLGDQKLGYSAKLTGIIMALRENLSDPQQPADILIEEPAGGHRDERGHFTAAYNQAHAKGDADMGPVFRSVTEKRHETDLRQRKLVNDSPQTIQRKVLATLALPLLTDTGKTIQLDDYRGGHGIAEFGGPYRGETLERFLRDQKYLDAGDPLMAFHASFWLALEPATSDGPPAGVCYYVDGVAKALWTAKFTRASKVSSNGRVMPCLNMVMVHTGMGTPIFWQTYSGHAGLVKETLPILAKLEAIVGGGWAADRLTVIDSEANCVALFKRFDNEPKRLFVTRLRENQIKSPEDVADLGPWQPFRDGEEIAGGHLDLADSKDKKHPYRARVVLVRRRRTGSLSALVTNAPEDPYDTRDVAAAYFDRWRHQELRFRDFNQGTKFKYVRGYGKRLVQNFTVLTELDKLRAQRNRLRGRIAKQSAILADSAKGVKTAKLRFNAAKARRARQDGLVDLELAIEHTDRQSLQARIETTKTERDRHAIAQADIQVAEQTVAKAQAKLDQMTKRLPEIEAEMAELETRKEIYQADTELDQICTVYKLGFVLILEYVLREWFGGMRISLNGFMRQILSLPGTRTIEGKIEHIRIKASRNREIMLAVEAACERVNELGLVRKGRTVRLSVDWGPTAQRRGANSP